MPDPVLFPPSESLLESPSESLDGGSDQALEPQAPRENERSPAFNELLPPEIMMRQVAHELINPLTAIVGYAELLIGFSNGDGSSPSLASPLDLPAPDLEAKRLHAAKRLHDEAMRAVETSRRVLALTRTGRALTPSCCSWARRAAARRSRRSRPRR